MASDATSLASGESCSRSSSTPTTNIASAASRHRQPIGCDGRRASGLASDRQRSRRRVAAAIAIPPIVGVGALCQRSGRGGTTAPTAPARGGAPPRPPRERCSAQRRRTPIARKINHKRLATPITTSTSSAGAAPRSESRRTNGCRSRMPSQIVSSPRDSPGSSCCSASSLRR